MDKRHQRMLEEVLTLPGNETCADCHAGAPRWASVNLGIFLCVSCASVHRKLGTHKSRVKSVTLDSWSREQIVQMRNIGNRASNAIYNPNETLHPPPTNTGAEDRDSEIEKYIRRKYELGTFKVGAGRSPGLAPTSLNRARERDGRLPQGSVTGGLGIENRGGLGIENRGGLGIENRRNPELNDVLIKRDFAKDRDLPALPLYGGGGGSMAPPRTRPTRSASSTPGGVSNANANHNVLVNLEGGTSSTLPLQVTGYGSTNPFTQRNGASSNPINMAPSNLFSTSPISPSNHLQIPQTGYGYGQQGLSYSAPSTSTLTTSHQHQQQPMYQPHSFSPSQPFSISPTPSFHSQMGTSPTPSFHSQFGTLPNQPYNQFAQQPFLSPQFTQQPQQPQQQNMYSGQMIPQNGAPSYGQQPFANLNGGQWAGNVNMGMAGNSYNGMR